MIASESACRIVLHRHLALPDCLHLFSHRAMRVIATAGVALGLAASGVHAESCIDLSREAAALQSAQLELLAEYPGTAAAVFACAYTASQQPESQQTQTLIACLGMTCLVVGFSTCTQLAKRALAITTREEAIKKRQAALAC